MEKSVDAVISNPEAKFISVSDTFADEDSVILVAVSTLPEYMILKGECVCIRQSMSTCIS